ncbi:MAG: alpha/beta fold hydrolase [Cyanothece sp. SIO1E1]|nr:alpha/beta fold hydrolase [Cyanothece sp. SIO1E1]
MGNGYQRTTVQWIGGFLGGIALALSPGKLATPGLAAERLTVRLGPFEQSVEIADLEEFATTGELSPALKPYELFLTPNVRQILTSRLALDPNFGGKVIEEVLKSANGKLLLGSLGGLLPDVSIDQLQAAMSLATRQLNGLGVLGVLKALPQENITIDATSAIALASQVNFSFLQSQAASIFLKNELAVDGAIFQPTFDPAAPGPQAVRQQSLRFSDRQRNRTLLTDLYWSDDTQGPLVVMSHGFGANRKFLAYLARHLASHGLTVAAIEHPGSNVAALGNITLGDASDNPLVQLIPAREFLDRPRDISFLLDQLAQRNRQRGTLQGKLNTHQVSVIGHSLGGYTALALAGAELDLNQLKQFCQNRNLLTSAPADWLQCAAADLPNRSVTLKDARVSQVIALNPVTGNLFGAMGLSQVEATTLVLAGTDDALTPAVSQQIRPFNDLPAPKYLLTAVGGTHLSISDPANLPAALTRNSVVPERIGSETANLRQLLRGVSLALIKQQTPAAATYAPFLTAAYAQSLSTVDLALRLNTELPNSLSQWLGIAALSR